MCSQLKNLRLCFKKANLKRTGTFTKAILINNSIKLVHKKYLKTFYSRYNSPVVECIAHVVLSKKTHFLNISTVANSEFTRDQRNSSRLRSKVPVLTFPSANKSVKLVRSCGTTRDVFIANRSSVRQWN